MAYVDVDGGAVPAAGADVPPGCPAFMPQFSAKEDEFLQCPVKPKRKPKAKSRARKRGQSSSEASFR